MRTSPTKLGKFPKDRYKNKPNLDTNFESKTETATLPGTANWDGLFALQLDYVPAQASEGINQVITNPVVTCLNDSSTRTVRFYPVAAGQPAAGEVFIDLESGIIQFNSADASKNFQVQYYAKYSLIMAEDFNRVWAAGPEILVGDSAYDDYDNLGDAVAAASALVYTTIKLRKDLTLSAAVTFDKKIRLDGNGHSITKGSGANAIRIEEDCLIENTEFVDYDGVSDVAIYGVEDKKVWILKNIFTNCTQATNVGSVSSDCIIQANLPSNVNFGAAVPNTQIEVSDGVTSDTFDRLEFDGYTDMGSGVAKISPATTLSKNYLAANTITAFKPVFLSGTDCDHKSAVVAEDRATFLGLPANAGSATANIKVVSSGPLSGLSGLTAGDFYYVADDGNLTNDYMLGVILVGKALSTTVLNLGEMPNTSVEIYNYDKAGKMLSPVSTNVTRLFRKIFEPCAGYYGPAASNTSQSLYSDPWVNLRVGAAGGTISGVRLIPGTASGDFAEFSFNSVAPYASANNYLYEAIYRFAFKTRLGQAPSLSNDNKLAMLLGWNGSSDGVEYIRMSYNGGSSNYFVWEPGSSGGTWHDSGISPGGNSASLDAFEIYIRESKITYVINGTFIGTYDFVTPASDNSGRKPKLGRPVIFRNTWVAGTAPYVDLYSYEQIVRYKNKR